jgi:hypothetical protein
VQWCGEGEEGEDVGGVECRNIGNNRDEVGKVVENKENRVLILLPRIIDDITRKKKKKNESEIENKNGNEIEIENENEKKNEVEYKKKIDNQTENKNKNESGYP